MPVSLEECMEWWGIDPPGTDAPAITYSGQDGRLNEHQFTKLSEMAQVLWRGGERHQLSLGLAGLMAKEGYVQSDVERLIRRVCGATSDTEVEDRLRAVRDTYLAAAQGRPVVGWSSFASKLGWQSADYLRGLLKPPCLGSPPGNEEVSPYEDLFELTVPQEFPTYPALIEGVLPSDPRGQVAYLSGLSQSFKSYLSLDWASHIAIGRDWQGHSVDKGETLYVVGEGTYEYIFSRLRAWEAHHLCGGRVEGIKVRLSPIPLMDREGVLRTIDRYSLRAPEFRPRLVILDTLSQCALGADENSNNDARRIYANAKEFGKAWGSTVLIVCHRGKSDSNITRGASAFFDDSDAVIEMVRPCWQYGGLGCTMNVRKLKTGKLLIGHEMSARLVTWDDGARSGSDLVLVQMFSSSALHNSPGL